MIKSTNRKRPTPKAETAALPIGVKVVPAPKSAASRKLLSEPEITTSGGCRTVHLKHFLGVGDQIFFLLDIFPSADAGGYRIELVPVRLEAEQRSTPQIQSVPTTASTRQEAQIHGRTTYDQAIVEARAHATKWFKGHLAELDACESKAKLGTFDYDQPDFRLDVVEAPDWKSKIKKLQRERHIDDEWIKAVAGKTQSKGLREALCELARLG